MTVAVAGQRLRGRAILVTRPRDVAEPLCRLIEAVGGEAVRCPTLDILPPRDASRARALLSAQSLAQRDWVIFVSPTAVRAALATMEPSSSAGAGAARFAGAKLAAVGQGTAHAATAQGLAPVLTPEQGADGAALAALPQLGDLAGASVLIVRGEGGRDELANTLRSRGAAVEMVDCYRRALPELAPAAKQELSARWKAGRLHAVSVTSREALDNLLRLFEEQQALLRATPLFAAHQRVAERARESGFTEVVACDPGDAAMLHALQTFFGRS